MSNPIRESKIESYLKDQITNIGGLHFKHKSTRNGVPDQMIIYDGGIYLVEVKRPGEKPSQQQQHIHDLIGERGVTVHITATYKDVDNFVRTVLKTTPTKVIKDNTPVTIKSKDQFKMD